MFSVRFACVSKIFYPVYSTSLLYCVEICYTLSTYRVGNHIPTTDVYEALYNGIKFEDLPCVFIKATNQNTLAAAYIGLLVVRLCFLYVC